MGPQRGSTALSLSFPFCYLGLQGCSEDQKGPLVCSGRSRITETVILLVT